MVRYNAVVASYCRIIRAANEGKGVRLNKYECFAIATLDDAVKTAATCEGCGVLRDECICEATEEEG